MTKELLPDPPKRATIGRFAPTQWEYKGEVSEWPIIAQRYARDLLLLAADTIERWPDTDTEQDKSLVAAIKVFCR
jgi:hypothetical protein